MLASPELSIIVPVLDEAATLAELFRNLDAQTGVRFELLLCDGGSADATVSSGSLLAGTVTFPCHILSAPRGRATQMNAGAKIARGDFVLFLHADSSFADPLTLRQGIDALRERLAGRGDHRVAGRFALRFRRRPAAPSLAYHFYECKARLDRLGCIHGDQGFLFPRHLFEEIGPFDASLPVLEDDRLADRVRRHGGEWLLLPAEIMTSARRFENEGMWQRQLLNALMMNFAALAWFPFFHQARGTYQTGGSKRKLRLLPFFRLIRRLLGEMTLRDRFRLWYGTGAYVRGNAWQLAFWFDARRSFRRGLPPGEGGTPTLVHFDRWFDRLTDHPPGRLAVALLTWGWFQVMSFFLTLTGERRENHEK